MWKMDVIPAIDILDGRVVRLLRGDFEHVTVYEEDPAAVAREWVVQGAPLVHVVDLEGARSGSPSGGLAESLGRAGIRFQLGGGIRDAAAARAAVAAGAARVVAGTAAVADPDALGAIVREVGSDAVVVAIDVKAGRVLGSGWLDSGKALSDTLAAAIEQGVVRVLVTGISRDGTMEGPDLDLLEAVRSEAPALRLIASGGVGSLDDLAALKSTGVESVIVGRALYEGRFSLGEAIGTAR
jgi:phosphoribosylformimino-5-aminoimidazole carboxamide ribotide isomerase